MQGILPVGVVCLSGVLWYSNGCATEESDRSAVARLDTEFQAAVKNNDADAMARILHKDMVLVLGDGSVGSRDEQLQEARKKLITYEIQDEEAGTQSVRVSGDTAIVTALLRIKGVRAGKAFDEGVWFSDTYIRTPSGWQYLFGQASLPLQDRQKQRR